jgi:putative ABC transport system permease protein
MLRNYLKIAWRKLLKHKIDSAISIGGLAIGIACCLLLVLSVRFELTYDNFHTNEDRLFRVTTTNTTSKGEVNHSLLQSYPMAEALETTFPEIEHTVRLTRGGLRIKRDNKFYKELGVILAGPDFFQMFSFPLVAGNDTTVLSAPNSVVLTQKMAKKLFDTQQAMGKMVTFRKNGEERTYEVTGITKNVPPNSSIKFDIILPFKNTYLGRSEEREKQSRTSWYEGNSITWLMLKEGSSATNLKKKLSGLLKKHMDPSFAENKSLGLQPLDDVYFSQKYTYAVAEFTNIRYTLILGFVALIILCIAGMNFMSLTLSRISGRHHEIGIRKASGAQKNQLRGQLLGEILLTCGIALMFGMVLTEMLTPFYREIIQKTFPLGILRDPVSWLLLGGILLLITFITGLYPALVVTNQKTSALFGSQRSAERIPGFVKGLIVAQFALSIAFLIMTFTMQKQMNLFFSKDLGFTPENVVSVEFSIRDSSATQLARQFQRRAQQIQGVQHISATDGDYNMSLSYGYGMVSMHSVTGIDGFKDGGVQNQFIDEDYLATMGIPLLKGHNFSQDKSSELKNGIIVNQQFVNVLGWENPVGRIIKDSGDEGWERPLNGKKIIGVVADYHFEPLKNGLKPLFLQHFEAESYAEPGTIVARINNNMTGKSIKELNSIWNELFPAQPFNYKFMDDLLASQYESEQRWSTIMKLASAATVLLACFGLFGLAAFSAQRRTKEIGIRKVLGATVTNIVGLLSKDFLKLVMLGFIIAVPIAWYAMNWWLADFAYRIDIGPGIFLLAGGLALLIALATVSWQSIRAALANPVDSLRSE